MADIARADSAFPLFCHGVTVKTGSNCGPRHQGYSIVWNSGNLQTLPIVDGTHSQQCTLRDPMTKVSGNIKAIPVVGPNSRPAFPEAVSKN